MKQNITRSPGSWSSYCRIPAVPEGVVNSNGPNDDTLRGCGLHLDEESEKCHLEY